VIAEGKKADLMFCGEFKLPKPQRLCQRFERDCGVCVFAELAGVSREEILRDLPQAHLGTVSVDAWTEWLEKKGWAVLRQQECPDDIVPCAHLVGRSNTDFHWIFRDAEGDVHDPSPVFTAMPADDPRMKSITFYPLKVLTLSISRLT
jgi:hypothetical protein